MNEQAKVLCESCERYFDSYFVTKNQNGYNYCESCNNMQNNVLNYKKPISKKDFDKMMKMALDTPPLKLSWEKKNKKKLEVKKTSK